MRNAIAVVWTVLLLGLSSVASAQCSALVKDGVFETFDSSSENVSVKAFMNWVRDHHSSSSSSSAGGGISIPVIGSLNGSSEQYSQLESDYAAMNAGNTSARSRLITHARSVSATLAQRFNECLAIRGLHVWLETTSDPHVFRVAAVFNSPGRQQTKAVIDDVDLVPSNLTCNRVIARGTEIFGSTKRMRCTRNTDAAVAITVNADSDPIGGGQMELAAILPPARQVLAPTCDLQVLASRGATASSERLTDGTVGPNSSGQNSGAPVGKFWIELSQPAWIHHLELHPFMNGTVGSGTVVGYDSGGNQTTLTQFETRNGSAPITIYVDINKSKNIKKIEVNTTSANGRDWWAFTEIEVFVCR